MKKQEQEEGRKEGSKEGKRQPGERERERERRERRSCNQEREKRLLNVDVLTAALWRG